MDYNNHLKLGKREVTHKDKQIVTSLNSKDFQDFLDSTETYEFDVGTIPPGFEHRADLISNLFYGTPTLDWLICWANNVSDPFQGLNIGDTIKILKLN